MHRFHANRHEYYFAHRDILFISSRKGVNQMPDISCSAHTCAHNQQGYCAKDNIKIEGQCNCDTNDCTCCESFETKTGCTDCGCTATNRCGSNKACVTCSAVDCTHNKGGACRADHINVEGRNAHCCSDTCCETYHCCK